MAQGDFATKFEHLCENLENIEVFKNILEKRTPSLSVRRGLEDILLNGVRGPASETSWLLLVLPNLKKINQYM